MTGHRAAGRDARARELGLRVPVQRAAAREGRLRPGRGGVAGGGALQQGVLAHRRAQRAVAVDHGVGRVGAGPRAAPACGGNSSCSRALIQFIP